MDAITLVGILMILVCYALGVALVRKGLEEIRFGVGARTWPLVDAHLERCVLNVRRTGDRGTLYDVSVSYTYHLAGRRYTGNCLAIGYSASSNRQAHELAHQRVIGMTVHRDHILHPAQCV